MENTSYGALAAPRRTDQWKELLEAGPRCDDVAENLLQQFLFIGNCTLYAGPILIQRFQPKRTSCRAVIVEGQAIEGEE